MSEPGRDEPPAPSADPAASLEKAYRPADHEPRVLARWHQARAFAADPARVIRGEARPYAVLIPPPNVTAALHLGHALNNTIQDVLVRAHRMMGFETLWMPGTDHAGIATQTVVDRRLRESGQPGLAEHKRMEAAGENGRELFVQKVQAWKDEYEARITDQLKQMGCSCDWDRRRFTMDPVCAAAVREAFFRLFRDGLIYRGKRLVNWDPVTQTALADDEVEMHEVQGHFYSLRYPLVRITEPRITEPPTPATHTPAGPGGGPRRVEPVTWGELLARGYPPQEVHHPEDDAAWVTVATTRPETYLGDTAVAVNPTDPRAQALRGLSVELPLVGRLIPIIEDAYVVKPVRFGGERGDPKAEMATGFLKVTPAHDPNDWDIGTRHRLAVINVMAPDASISASHGWDDLDPASPAAAFVGATRERARGLVVEAFRAATINGTEPLLEAVRDHPHSVGHSYRSHAAIEPYLSDQWYCKVTDDRLRGRAQRAIATPDAPASTTAPAPAPAPMAIHPDRYARTYEAWHDGLRDWCISRQLWWGHRIPVWSAQVPAMSTRGVEMVAVLDAWAAQGRAAYQRDGDTLHVCLRAEDDGLAETLEAMGLTQDQDVLDTWFSSALWPLSTLGWPGHDLPVVHPKQIERGDTDAVRAIYVKRVGTWRDFIGVGGEPSGELIDALLILRDRHRKTGGPQPLNYQLFRESDLAREGDRAVPLLSPDDIQSADDLLCAVAVKTDVPHNVSGRPLDLPAFLESHGFRSTQGLLKAFNPTSALCTAREIITLWVSRMVMFNRHFLAGSSVPDAATGTSADAGPDTGPDGPVPFRDVFIHAMIQDGEGRKMSKSLGNGVDPLDIIAAHGADAMRFTLVEMTTQTQDVRMPVEPDPATGRNTSPKFDLGRNFCNKLWNASRFALGILAPPAPDTSPDTRPIDINSIDTDSIDPRPIDPQALPLVDRWMLTRLRGGIQDIERALREFQFSAYARALYTVVRDDFCDFYLEAIKPTVRHNPAQQAALRHTLDALLRLLHPVVPFITEAVHERLHAVHRPPIAGLTLGPPRRGDLLATAAWPLASEALDDPAAERRFERLRGLVTAVRQARSQHQVKPKKAITLHADPALLDDIAAGGGLVETLCGLGTITPDPPRGPSAVFTFDGREHRLSDLADALDARAERDRLARQLEALTKKLAGFEARLANPGYTDRAPAHLVQQTRDERDACQRDLQATRRSLEDLA